MAYTQTRYKTEKRIKIDTSSEDGKKLLEQYHKKTEYQYMDAGRIGWHSDYGEYRLTKEDLTELIHVPKVILRYRENAIDKQGRDVYYLKSFFGRLGELHFEVYIDRDKAELFLIENVWIANTNHYEDYNVKLFGVYYYNSSTIPFREIFFKFGISANPDDYGKRFKKEDEEKRLQNIKNTIVKLDLAKKIAQNILPIAERAALKETVKSLQKSGDYGKKILGCVNTTIKKNAELSKAPKPVLTSTKNELIKKAVVNLTTPKDLKSKKVVNTIVNLTKIQSAPILAVKAKILAITPKNIIEHENRLNLGTEKCVLPPKKISTKKPKFEPFKTQEEYLDIKNEKLVTQIKIQIRDFKPSTIDNKLINVNPSVKRFEAKPNQNPITPKPALTKIDFKKDKDFSLFDGKNTHKFDAKLKKLDIDEAQTLMKKRKKYQMFLLTEQTDHLAKNNLDNQRPVVLGLDEGNRNPQPKIKPLNIKFACFEKEEVDFSPKPQPSPFEIKMKEEKKKLEDLTLARTLDDQQQGNAFDKNSLETHGISINQNTPAAFGNINPKPSFENTNTPPAFGINENINIPRPAGQLKKNKLQGQEQSM